MERIVPCVLALGVSAGCYRGLGDLGAEDGAGTADESSSSADAGTDAGDDSAVVVPSALRRLSRAEYERTLLALFGAEAVASASVSLARVPEDRTDETAFSTMANGVTARHVEAYYRVADDIAAFVTATPERRQSLAECLAGADPDLGCLEGFFMDFGRRVYRRPLTGTEVNALVAVYQSGAALSTEDGLALALVRMLIAPPFLYRLEIDDGQEEVAPGTFRLDGYEVVTRLAFLAWGAGPDDELLTVVPALDDEAVYQAQVDRVFGDDRAVAHVQQFFDEWLGSDQLPTAEQPEAFLGGVDPEGLSVAMRAELHAYVAHHVFDNLSNPSDFYTSRLGFVGTPGLAAVYGVAPGDGQELPELQREGVLTRAALLVGAGESTQPIRRGAFIRNRILCETLEQPDRSDVPPGSVAPPPFDPDKTARQRWAEQTNTTGCVECHSRINSLGLALEQYDTLGRFRGSEPIIDPETGQTASNLLIDATVDVELGPGEFVTVQGAAGLGKALAASDAAIACMARQWLRFALGRWDTPEDAQLVERLTAALRGDQAELLAMFEEIARSPHFRLRRVQ